MNIAQLRARVQELTRAMHTAADAAQAAPDDDAAHEAFVSARAAVEEAKAQLERAEGFERARSEHPMPDPDPDPETPEQSRDTSGIGRIEVRQEEDVYRPDKPGFFHDLVRTQRFNDSEARERLLRSTLKTADDMLKRSREATIHPSERVRMEVHSRAISQSATAGGEFIPPLWLNEYEPLLRAGRAFADQCMSTPLPEKTNSINVPKITTGASVAVQADSGGVSNTDQVTTSVTAQVQTLAGRSVASYQLIDLSQPGMDEVIYQDLLAEYWKQYDSALISGNVVNARGFLNTSGINAVTYTDASPTGPELYAPVFQAKAQIEKGAFAPVDFSLWHPSTWDWYLSQLDTANRPLALSMDFAAFNAMAMFNPNAQGIAGNFAGIPVVIDANMPVTLGGGTNESRIGLFNRRTLRTYEGAPSFKVADQTNIANLQYQFVMYGYYAVAFGRQPKMISAISGTGLVVQSGF